MIIGLMARKETVVSDSLSCSFCHKSEHQVEKLVAGPSGVYICDACVAIAARIMADAGPPAARPSLWQRAASRTRRTLDRLGRRFPRSLAPVPTH